MNTFKLIIDDADPIDVEVISIEVGMSQSTDEDGYSISKPNGLTYYKVVAGSQPPEESKAWDFPMDVVPMEGGKPSKVTVMGVIDGEGIKVYHSEPDGWFNLATGININSIQFSGWRHLREGE